MKRALFLVLMLAAATSAAPLSTLSARYPLRSDAGDVSGHGNALGIAGSPVFGATGMALDGFSYLFRTSDLSDFDSFRTGVTFAARIRITDLTQAGVNQHVIHWQGSTLAGNIRLFYAGQFGRMAFAAAADATPSAYPGVVWTSPPPVGEEVAIIGWVDPGNHRIGIQQGDAEPVIASSPGLIQDACTGLWIGSKRDAALWKGTIRDVMIVRGCWSAAARKRYVSGP